MYIICVCVRAYCVAFLLFLVFSYVAFSGIPFAPLFSTRGCLRFRSVHLTKKAGSQSNGTRPVVVPTARGSVERPHMVLVRHAQPPAARDLEGVTREGNGDTRFWHTMRRSQNVF